MLRTILIAFLVLITYYPLFAQDGDDRKEPFVLRYADSLLGITTNAGFVRELHGNVEMAQGRSVITCDRAIQYVDGNRADLFGNVVFTRDSLRITAPQAQYDGTTRIITGQGGITLSDGKATLTALRGAYDTETTIARFFTNVRVETDSLIITSDTLRYTRTTQHSFARGNVRAQGTASLSEIRAGRLQHFPDSGITVAWISPVLYKWEADSSGVSTTATASSATSADSLAKTTTGTVAVQDTLIVAADTLRAYRSSTGNYYRALQQVRIVKGSLAALSTTALYNEPEELFILNGEATLWRDSTELSADSLAITLRNNTLRRIYAYGNAFSATKRDTILTTNIKHDQLTGASIEFLFDKTGNLQRIIADRDAASLFFQFTEDKQPDGSIRNIAESIVIEIADNDVQEVFWIKNAEGEYYPEPITQKLFEELKLPSFRLRQGKPSTADFKR